MEAMTSQRIGESANQRIGESASQRIHRPVPEEAVQQQRDTFAALLENLGQASSAEIKRALDEREEVAPEPGLDPAVVARLRQRIADASASV